MGSHLQHAAVHHPRGDPADVAKGGFEALMAGKDHVVGGASKNRPQTAASKLIPDVAKSALHSKMTKPST